MIISVSSKIVLLFQATYLFENSLNDDRLGCGIRECYFKFRIINCT